MSTRHTKCLLRPFKIKKERSRDFQDGGENEEVKGEENRKIKRLDQSNSDSHV